MNKRTKGNSKRNYQKKSDRRSDTRQNPRGNDENYRQDDTRANNDISWYMQDKALMEAAGHFNFNNPLGNKFRRVQGAHVLDENANPSITTDMFATVLNSVPGIAVLMSTPFFGVAGDANAPINISARALFGHIRSTLSAASLGIDSPDLMAYIIAADSLYSFYSWMCRIYGLASTQNVLNKYQGRRLVQANGVSYDDLVENYATLRYYIRLFAKKVNAAIKMPKGYGIIERHFWLYNNVFKDGENEKSQMYIHVPSGFYKFRSATRTEATWEPFITNKMVLSTFYELRENDWDLAHMIPGSTFHWEPLTVEQIIGYGNALLDAMLYSDDAANISGLVLRTFGSAGTYVLNDLPDDYSVAPVYTKEILEQIHNMNFLGVDLAAAAFQDDNTPMYKVSAMDYVQAVPSGQATDPYLRCTPSWGAGENIPATMRAWTIGSALNLILDSREETPSAETVMLDSRCIQSSDVTLDAQGNPTNLELVTAGLELYGNLIVLGNYPALENEPRNRGVYLQNTILASTVGITDATSETSIGTTAWSGFYSGVGINIPLNLAAVFDWFPRVAVVFTAEGTDGATFNVCDDQFEYNNYTQIQRSDLEKLHEAALMGAFAMPIQSTKWNG